MKILAAVLGLGIMLAGCSSNVEDTKPVEDNSTSTTVSAPVETTSNKESVADAKAHYHELLQEPLNGLIQAMGKFSELNGQAGQDPSMLADSDWQIDMASTLVDMQRYIQDVQAINPPDAVADVHDTLLQAMDEYQFVVDNFPTALDTLDSSLIDECTSHMKNGNDLVGQATDEMTALN